MDKITKPKKRIMALVDGFNLYHSIAENPQHTRHKNSTDLRKYKWLNLWKLMECFLSKNEELVEVVYFSAYAFWKQERVTRHQTYVRALRSVGVKPVISEFKKKTKKCKICKKIYDTYEEKQTDVQVAIHLFKEGMNDRYEKAMIVTGDSDLIPAIEAVKEKFPMKEIKILFPPLRAINSLKQVADSYARIRPHHLIASQFPDEIDIGDDTKIVKPKKWR